MSTTINTTPCCQLLTENQAVDASVQSRIDRCDYRFEFKRVTWHFDAGILTLLGRVPNFYLKQVVQELLRGIEHVDQIYNDVDVVSSNGLSSIALADKR